MFSFSFSKSSCCRIPPGNLAIPPWSQSAARSHSSHQRQKGSQVWMHVWLWHIDPLGISVACVTLHATLYRNSNPCSPLTHVCFQDPYFISITFLFSILTLKLDSIFRTLYTQPCLTLPIPCRFPSTMTNISAIPSRTYSSPCCSRNPA